MLDLKNCNNLELTDDLVDQMESLENQGCQIAYPQNIDPLIFGKKAETRLKKVIDLYYLDAGNEPISDATSNLFHDYLAKEIDLRADGNDFATKARKIARSTEPFLEFIEKNPHHLTWIDNICKYHTEGCVNQPVAGFSEINALISVAQKENFSDKIAGAKHSIALQEIKTIVAKNSPGEFVQVEAGNVALVELHQNLLRDGLISEPWFAVPEKIAYGGAVESWLGQSHIKDEINNLKNRISKLSIRDCAEFLCDGIHHERWEKIAFPHHPEIEQIKDRYLEMLEAGEEINLEDREKEIREKVKNLTFEKLGIKNDLIETSSELLLGKLMLSETDSNYSSNASEESPRDHAGVVADDQNSTTNSAENSAENQSQNETQKPSPSCSSPLATMLKAIGSKIFSSKMFGK